MASTLYLGYPRTDPMGPNHVLHVRDLGDFYPAAATPLPYLGFSERDGFNWGYGWSGTALALSLLADHLGEGEQVQAYTQSMPRSGHPLSYSLHEAFARDVVATFPPDGAWVLTGDQIDTWLAARPVVEQAPEQATNVAMTDRWTGVHGTSFAFDGWGLAGEVRITSATLGDTGASIEVTGSDLLDFVAEYIRRQLCAKIQEGSTDELLGVQRPPH